MFTQSIVNNTHNKNSIKATKSSATDSIPSFIRKTYDILEECKFPDIIDWNPEGTALVIKKPSEFCSKVLPQYFKHNNLTSFVRQLNMYNFHKRRTQNIDHVYAHELFQRGKKHLLKDIRRKNHDNNASTTSDKTPLRLPDTLEGTQSPQDMNSILYENQFLKRLYNDAMSKLNLLEGQIQELSNQNQTLWSQLNQKNQGNPNFKPQQMIQIQRDQSLTLDQLPMTCGGVAIPPLKLNIEPERTIPAPNGLSIAKLGSMGVSSFFNMEESTEPCESSYTSPSAQNKDEAEHIKVGLPAYQSLLTITPQVSQIQTLKNNNDLRITRQEMSIGQLLDSWNVEVQGETNGLLGKREPTDAFDLGEPSLKRHELSIFSKKGFFSNLSNGLFNNTTEDFGMDLLTFTN